MPITKPSERSAPLSPAMKRSFVELEKLKRKGDVAIDLYYQEQFKKLDLIFADFNPEKGLTKSQIYKMDIWSAETAEGRNKILQRTVAESVDIANKYLAAEMDTAWGTVDESLFKRA